MKFNKTALFTATLLSTVAPWAVAQAQTGLEEIVVTARKREENLYEAPLSITSVSSKEIERANIRDITELTAFTPGFYYTQQASFQAMRLSPGIRFRAVTNGSNAPLFQLGGVFLDGIFLLGGAQSLTMDDVERVEVIKGPQSALFGRSTFAGAINFITKQPADHFAAQATVGVETRGTYQLTGSVDSPLVDDKLFVRLSGGRTVKGSHFKTTDGGSLGYESTNTINAQLVFKPTDALTIRVRRWDNWQDDSRGTTVNMNSSNPLLAGAPRICKTGTDPYWCGAIPTVGSTGVPFSAISVATIFNTNSWRQSNNPNLLIDILNNNRSNPLVRNGLPYYNDVPYLDHAGLHGKYARTTFEVEYELANEWTLAANYETSKVSSMSASTSSGDGGEGWVISPNILSSESAEFRVTSDPNQRLTGLAGANYFALGELGGLAGVGGLPSVNAVSRLVSYLEPAVFTSQARLKGYGAFLALHYGITDHIAVDLEGRYNSERVTSSYQLPTQTSTVFKSFVPRAILTYKSGDGLMAYASFGQGKLPGTQNSIVPLLSPAIQAQIRATPGYADTVGAETLRNLELGVKYDSDRWRAAIAGYNMKWSNLKNSLTITCPNNLCGPNLPGSSIGATLGQVANYWGFEVEGGFVINDNWDVSASFDYVTGKFVHLYQPLTITLAGSQDASGKKVTGFPDKQATLSTNYHDEINADWGWYLRGDLTYTGRIYIDEINQSWVGPKTNVNLHLGVESEKVRVDTYVNNVFNNRQWLGSGRAFQSIYTISAARVTQGSATSVLPRLRAFGVRATVKY